MNVFISWSGEPSQAVARSLRKGILAVFDNVTPFVSDEDIGAGSRRLSAIEAELQKSTFGIIVVTPENMNSTWLNFEAGALSKALTKAKTRVVPLLVEIESDHELTGPLTQFQARRANEESVKTIFYALGDLVNVEREIVDQRLRSWLPTFMAVIRTLGSPAADAPPKRSTEELLDTLIKTAEALRDYLEPSANGRSITVDLGGDRVDFQGMLRESKKKIRSILKAQNLKEKEITVAGGGAWMVRLSDTVPFALTAVMQQQAANLGVKAVFTSG